MTVVVISRVKCERILSDSLFNITKNPFTPIPITITTTTTTTPITKTKTTIITTITTKTKTTIIIIKSLSNEDAYLTIVNLP